MKTSIKLIMCLGGIALLAGVYYAISPLWNKVNLNEASPENAVPLSTRQIVDTKAHPASGTVSVLQAGEEFTLRYENFKTINGPDLRVYLSSDLEATEFVDLGELKATEGSVNYSIPPNTDLSRYRYALVWCEDFSVLFNHADLQP